MWHRIHGKVNVVPGISCLLKLGWHWIKMSPLGPDVATWSDGFRKSVVPCTMLLVEPWAVKVLVHFSDCTPLCWIHGKHLLEQCKQIWREISPFVRRHSGDSTLPLNKFIIVWITQSGLLPGISSSQHAEKEDAYWPHITRTIYNKSSCGEESKSLVPSRRLCQRLLLCVCQRLLLCVCQLQD